MSYFITGTDTGVGKTLVSCALLHGFAAQGKRVVGFKPVAAGCDDDDHNEDAKRLRVASNVHAAYGQINPYCFPHAIAPHLAARHAGVRIEFSRILASYHELAGQAEEVIVEGVGGFCVPLNEKQDSADLAKQFDLPIILVVGMRLGCLNHALLTQRAIADCQLEFSAWVANVLDADGASSSTSNVPARGRPMGSPLLHSDPFALLNPNSSLDEPAMRNQGVVGRVLTRHVGLKPDLRSNELSGLKADMPALQENIEALCERLSAPLLGVIPYQQQPDAQAAAAYLNLELLVKKETDG